MDDRAAHEQHIPVLLDRCVELLLDRPTDAEHQAEAGPRIIVDATLGMGGHAEALLLADPEVRVLGIDRDPAALTIAGERLRPFGGRFTAVRATFDRIDELLTAPPDGFLFDLGVSSLQLDSDERGFSYSRATRLDMRMDPDGPLTAEDVLNDYPADELAGIFRDYGEERFAGRIARAIQRRRAEHRITTSEEVADIVRACVPADKRRTGHPAKRVFQALRIEVNDELGILSSALDGAIRSCAIGGRIVVMSYHSLEDRIVKRRFAAGISPPVPPGLPIVPESARPFLRALTRGAEQASEDETRHNPRASSVRLRAVVKVAQSPSDW